MALEDTAECNKPVTERTNTAGFHSREAPRGVTVPETEGRGASQGTSASRGQSQCCAAGGCGSGWW